MISAKFLWGNVLLGGKLQIGAKNSNFEIFESALYMKSVSMPLITCVIVQSNPRRLLQIWRKKLHGHYHVTMTCACDVGIIASAIRA